MIPFVKTDLGEEEKKAVADVIDNGWVVLGPKTAEFEAKFAEYVGAKHAIFVDSGTSALLLAVQYAKTHKRLSSGMPIEVPSLTFVATAEVLVNSGYDIEFGDVKEDFCLETPHLDSLPVHLTGNRAEYGALIYDSAHRIEKDDLKDTHSQLWCYSFYATKNITTVTGGMIATNDDEAATWLRQARDHGLNLGTKERYTGKYKQYDVEFVGWRVKGDDFRAVVGIEQLKKLPRLTERRNELVERYNKAFGLNRTGNHLYPIMVTDREQFMNFMHDNDIQTTVHFRPLHTMTAYKKFYRGQDLSNTNRFGEHIVSIPLYPRLTNEEQDYIINKIHESRYFFS